MGSTSILKHLIEEIKTKRDLVQYITTNGVELFPEGTLLAGLCPFHEDKNTRSLKVYPDGHWKCYGCDARATSLNFVDVL